MACSRRDHDSIKRSLTEFRCATIPCGVQPGEGDVPDMELGSCNRCGSTLAYERPDLAATVPEMPVAMGDLLATYLREDEQAHGGHGYCGDEEVTAPGGGFLVNANDERNER